MNHILGREVSFGDVKRKVVERFAEVFGYELRRELSPPQA